MHNLGCAFAVGGASRYVLALTLLRPLDNGVAPFCVCIRCWRIDQQNLCVQDFTLEQGIAGDTHLGGKDFASLVVDFGTQDFSLEMKATAGAKDNIE